MSTARYHPPFSLDTILHGLNKVPFSPPFLLILPLLVAILDCRSLSPTEVLPKLFSREGFSQLLHQHKWLRRALVFILIKTASRYFSRRAANNREFKADPIDWTKDIVVVTGGSTGIGKELVELLSRRYRAKIAVLDITPPTYAAAQQGASPILYIRTDITKSDAIASAHRKIIETFGASPSIVVSCAGIAIGAPILALSPDTALKTMEINAFANLRLAQEFVPYMVKNNHGHYMTVASSASYYTPPMLSSYAMSKAAALAFHEELRGELRAIYKAPRVRTTVVTPTKVRTKLGHALKDAHNGFIVPTLEPIEVAQAMADALDSGLSQNISQPLATKLLMFVRAMPDWYRGLLEMVGRTDGSVTRESIKEAIAAGYGANFDEEDKQRLFSEMQSLFSD
ncbi:hypothetical protein MYAM1_000063 [Malassezia yamatoensis]|uniref:Ketoreductase domain-containing protein n=1 Tax=Malassezia yamatoensis TaxID=253288 RepID=A0AAJ5YN51_9BASI|nr:hypothetical protein MYAM1_000063 [Malassezia yamatoensis]